MRCLSRAALMCLCLCCGPALPGLAAAGETGELETVKSHKTVRYKLLKMTPPPSPDRDPSVDESAEAPAASGKAWVRWVVAGAGVLVLLLVLGAVSRRRKGSDS